MAKLNKSQKFARSLNNIKRCEDLVTNIIKDAIINFYVEDGNPALLSFVYTGIVIANTQGALRPEQEKAITDFIIKFCAVDTGKELDGTTRKDDQGNVVLLKDKEKHEKKMKSLKLSGDNKSVEFKETLLVALSLYLHNRSGSVFGKVKKKEKTVKDESEMTTEEKLQAIAERKKKELLKVENNKKAVAKLAADLAWSQSEKARHLKAIASSLGFDDLTVIDGLLLAE